VAGGWAVPILVSRFLAGKMPADEAAAALTEHWTPQAQDNAA